MAKLFRFFICVFYLLFFIFYFDCSFANQIEITKITSIRTRGFDYLDIHTTGYSKGKGLLLDNQLTIDFPNARIAKNIKIAIGKSKRIKNVVTKQLKKSARVIINLKKSVDYEIVNVFGKNKSVIEICDQLDYTERLMAAWEKTALKRKGQRLKPYRFDPIFTAKDQSLSGKVIVVDPGHGGKDPGAFSAYGIPEKHLTLQTARKVARRLNKAGATVYLTRNEDRTSNLRDIVRFANKVKADIFISIHYNYSYNKKASGTETYYYTRRSRKLGAKIHQSLIHGMKRKDRGLRRARFYAIRHTNMPAILLEPLFISNVKEANLARSPSFQEELAYNILKGVKNYF